MRYLQPNTSSTSEMTSAKTKRKAGLVSSKRGITEVQFQSKCSRIKHEEIQIKVYSKNPSAGKRAKPQEGAGECDTRSEKPTS